MKKLLGLFIGSISFACASQPIQTASTITQIAQPISLAWSDENLSDQKKMAEVVEKIQGTQNLKELKLINCTLSPQNLDALAPAIKDHPTLTALDLGYNPLRLADSKLFAEALGSLKLTTLNLSEWQFDLISAQLFTPILEKNDQLEILKLEKITQKSQKDHQAIWSLLIQTFEKFVPAFKKTSLTSRLKHLNLSFNEIGAKEEIVHSKIIQNLFRSLRGFTELTTLDLSYNQLSKAANSPLMGLPLMLKHLKAVSLEDDNLTPNAFQKLRQLWPNIQFIG